MQSIHFETIASLSESEAIEIEYFVQGQSLQEIENDFGLDNDHDYKPLNFME